jgi:hypothetical protein
MGLLHCRRGGSGAAVCLFETRNSDAYAVIVAVCTCCSIGCPLATSGIKCFCFCLFFQSLLIVFLVWNEEFKHRLLVIFPGTVILLHLPNHY